MLLPVPARRPAAVALLLGASLTAISGTNGDDVIDRTWANRPNVDIAETISGLGGNDRIWGYGGIDSLVGGQGNDVLWGDDANDALVGGSHDDQLYGGAGDDRLKGDAGFDYLDGSGGSDHLHGGSEEDLLIGRGGTGTLIGGTGNDYFAIIGNSVSGYQVDGGDITGTETFTNLLFFAQDVNPANFMIVDTVSVQTPTNSYKYARLEFGLRTSQRVSIDLNAVPNVKHVHAVVTGTGADKVVGTGFTTRYAYLNRFRETMGIPHEMYVHELFMTGAGNDTVVTGAGSDFIDTEAGNDLIIIGPGAHRIMTGDGNDVIQVALTDLNGPETSGAAANLRSTIVYDFAAGDQARILGSITPAQVQFVAGTGETRVKVMDREEFILRGVASTAARVAVTAGGVAITVTGRTGGVNVPMVLDRSRRR